MSDEYVEKVESAIGSLSEKAKFLPIDINSIQFNGANDYEMNEEEILMLADDIYRNGLLHNPVVSLREDGSVVLISGEKRIRAIDILREDYPEDNRWDTIMANVYTGITPRQELILMDSANLQVRNVSKSDKSFRKAISRYIDNVKEEWGLSESEAIDLTEKLNGVNERTVKEAREIETKLNPAIENMLDAGEINKQDALNIAAMPEDEQTDLAIELTEADDPDEVIEEKVKPAVKKAKAEHKKAEDTEDEMPVTTTQLSPDEKLRMEYIRKFSTVANFIREMNDPGIVAQIHRLDENKREEEKSIEEVLMALAMAINELRNAVNASDGSYDVGRDYVYDQHLGSEDEEEYTEEANENEFEDTTEEYDSNVESNEYESSEESADGE